MFQQAKIGEQLLEVTSPAPLARPVLSTRTIVTFPGWRLGSAVAWASKQDDQPGRTEAIRRVVEIGLKVKK
jgi:hypothetical protein